MQNPAQSASVLTAFLCLASAILPFRTDAQSTAKPPKMATEIPPGAKISKHPNFHWFKGPTGRCAAFNDPGEFSVAERRPQRKSSTQQHSKRSGGTVSKSRGCGPVESGARSEPRSAGPNARHRANSKF